MNAESGIEGDRRLLADGSFNRAFAHDASSQAGAPPRRRWRLILPFARSDADGYDPEGQTRHEERAQNRLRGGIGPASRSALPGSAKVRPRLTGRPFRHFFMKLERGDAKERSEKLGFGRSRLRLRLRR